jgi:toluene monooxygenase system ferredoxin subunit
MAFRTVLTDEELWTGEMRGLVVDGRRVLVLRTERGVYAYEDRCAHLGVPLSRGTLSGRVLTCSAHHYQYDAESGRGINPNSVRLTALPVKIDAGAIAVDIGLPLAGGGA